SSYDQLLSHTVYAYTYGVQKSGQPGNRQVFGQTTYGPCYTPTCGNGSVNPAVIEPGKNYTYSILLGMTSLNSAPPVPPNSPTIGGTLTVTLPGGTIKKFTPPSLSGSGSGGTATAPATTGTYTLSWTFTDGSVSVSCPNSGNPPPTLIVA